MQAAQLKMLLINAFVSALQDSAQVIPTFLVEKTEGKAELGFDITLTKERRRKPPLFVGAITREYLNNIRGMQSETFRNEEIDTEDDDELPLINEDTFKADAFPEEMEEPKPIHTSETSRYSGSVTKEDRKLALCITIEMSEKVNNEEIDWTKDTFKVDNFEFKFPTPAAAPDFSAKINGNCKPSAKKVFKTKE